LDFQLSTLNFKSTFNSQRSASRFTLALCPPWVEGHVHPPHSWRPAGGPHAQIATNQPSTHRGREPGWNAFTGELCWQKPIAGAVPASRAGF